MIIIDCVQGSPEWFKARLFVPSASNFNKIITSTGKPSATAPKYADELLAQYLANDPLNDGDATFWMERGNAEEPNARDQYIFLKDVEVEQVGFILLDDRTAGCSPDGLIGADGMIEIKSPKPTTLVGYYRNGFPNADYKVQVQTQLWIAERTYCDFYAFHPLMKPFICRIERDEPFIKEIQKAHKDFNAKLEAQKKLLGAWKI